METVGEFLKERREAKDITQRELSDYIGYSSAQYVSNYERNLCAVPFKKLPKICKKLNISKKELKRAFVAECSSEIDKLFR